MDVDYAQVVVTRRVRVVNQTFALYAPQHLPTRFLRMQSLVMIGRKM